MSKVRNYNSDKWVKIWTATSPCPVVVKLSVVFETLADAIACVIGNGLTQYGRVTHIYVDKLTIIGSDNGLSPGRRQAII